MTLYRVVDAHNQGWHPTSDGSGGVIYAADYGFDRYLHDRPLPDLERDRGPLRPVLPVTGNDEQKIAAVFARAGRKTIATLAAALEEVFHQVRESQGGLANRSSYDYAMRTLTAGREGSWESEVLKDVILFGNTLNLAPNKRGEDNSIEVRRTAGPNRRVDVDGRQELVEVFTGWVTDPDRYTEVAETLAAIVSESADDMAPTVGELDGWKVVADQWLQPGGLANADAVTCYRLFYSLSENFNSSLL